MTIHKTFEVQGNLLFVTAWGKDDSIEDVIAYGQAIIEHAVQHNTSKVLCDERELVYAIKSFDTFKAAKTIAENAPKVAQVAIVTQPEQYDEALYWETVAINRGLYVHFFLSLDEARKWLEVE